MELENKILEIYKLPLSYDNDGQSIIDVEENKVADVRGWGTLQYQKNGEQLQDTLGEMLVKAFNEKYMVNNLDGYENDPTIKDKPEFKGKGGIITDGSVHEIFTFNKEPNGNWYIDLPDWEGSKDDLQMVMGADTMLERFAEGEDKVTMLISETDVENTCHLKLFKQTPELGGGGEYTLYDINEEYIMNVWLCKVTEHIFSKLPSNIYIAPVRF
jgi:hypothetical protein